LCTLVSLNNHQIQGSDRLPQFDGLLVFGQFPAIELRLVTWKFNHRIAGAAGSLGILELAGPQQKTGAVFPERLGIGRNIGIVFALIRNVGGTIQ